MSAVDKWQSDAQIALKMLRSAFVDADQLRDHAIALGLPICNIEAP
jgi:hypothetical protein